MLEVNKIYNEDCLEGIKKIDDGSVDLIVTDPPYLFDNGNWLSSGKTGTKSLLGRGDIFDPVAPIYQDMSEFGVEDIENLLEVLVKKMKKVNMYICCNETQVPIYGMWARNHGLHFTLLTWEKALSIINKNRFSTNAEYVVRIYDFGTGLNKVENNEFYNKVIHISKLVGKAKVHPTQKPVEMFSRFIQLSSNPGDLVLDPFMGSGTTAIACMHEKRKFIGFEKNTDFYNKSLQRIEDELAEPTLFDYSI